MEKRAQQRHDARAIGTYTRFMAEVVAETGWSTDEAERFLPSVVMTLEEQLTPAERRSLEAQLPEELCKRLAKEAEDEPRSRALHETEFLKHLAARTGLPDTTAEDIEVLERITRDACRVLRGHLSTGEAMRLEARLEDDDLKRLWNAPSFGRR